MKKFNIYIVATLICLSSCSKYLDKDPIGILTKEQVQVNPTEGLVRGGISNSYRSLSYTLNIYGNWDWVAGFVIRPDFILEDIASGDVMKKWSPDGDQAWMDDIANYNFTSENGAFNGIWKYNYDGIKKANSAIFQLTDENTLAQLNLSENTRKHLLGEVSFLRAFYYFDLVKLFGDVPMILKPLGDFNEAYEVAVRVSKIDVFKQIKDDLKVAIDGLPNTRFSDNSEKWRASKGAAMALLAKVALFEEDWNEVITQVNAIEQTNFYQLNTNYFDSFDESKSYTENENIFIYDHESGKQPSKGNGLAALLGWGFVAPTDDFLASFENGDPRKNSTVNVAEKSIYKLLGAQNSNYKGDDNSPVNRIFIRYADVLLWKAEALIKDGQIPAGIAIINRIRQRARGGNNAILPDRATNVDASQAMAWLQHERRVELGFESHRFSDLRRWKIAKQTLTAMSKPFQDKHMLFPIPQKEVDKTVGRISQNPDY